MRRIFFSLLVSVVLAFPAFAADSGAALELKGDQVFLVKNGKSTALDQDMFPAQPVGDTGMRFLGIGPDDAAEQGVEPGLYIFQDKGKPVAFAATEYAEFCAGVAFSPDGKILAMDAGTSLTRDWSFFSYPEMTPLGATEYYMTPDNPALVWVGEKGVLTSVMDMEGHERACGYDPCGPVSVVYHDFGTGENSVLLPGTDLCDYTLTGLEADGVTVTAAALCLPSSKDWEVFPEDAPVKNVTVKLP